MRIFLAWLALSGCASKHSPTPSDTKFKESQRDWMAIYYTELEIAIENEDIEARYFFLQEILKIKYKSDHNKTLPENPKLKILNQ